MTGKLKRTIAATALVIIAGVAIPSTVALAAGTGLTYHLSAKGGTVRFSATVKNAKTCHWSSSPKVTGFDATVKCKNGKVARSAKFKANPSAKARSYVMTLTVRGKSTTVHRWKVDEAGKVEQHAANGSGTMTVSPTTVAASSFVNTLTFTYTAATGGISGGEVTIEVPTGWTAPAGCTTSSLGSLNFSGQTIQVSNLTLAANARFTVTYGPGSQSIYCGGDNGVAVPSSMGEYTFTTSEASGPNAAVVAIRSSPVVTAGGPLATTTVATLTGQANSCIDADGQWECGFNLTATAVTSAPGEDSVGGGGYGFVDWLDGVPEFGWVGLSGIPTVFSEEIGTGSITIYVVATFSGPGYLGSSGTSNVLCLAVSAGGTPTITAGSCPGQ